MQKTDRYRYRCINVHNGIFQRGNTSVVRKVSLCHRSCVVDNHIRVMQKSLYDIYCMLRTMEVLFHLLHSTIGICEDNVIPRVDVNLVKVFGFKVRCKYRILHHLRIDSVNQSILIVVLNYVSVVKDELLDIGLQLIMLRLVCQR